MQQSEFSGCKWKTFLFFPFVFFFAQLLSLFKFQGLATNRNLFFFFLISPWALNSITSCWKWWKWKFLLHFTCNFVKVSQIQRFFFNWKSNENFTERFLILTDSLKCSCLHQNMSSPSYSYLTFWKRWPSKFGPDQTLFLKLCTEWKHCINPRDFLSIRNSICSSPPIVSGSFFLLWE